MMGLGMPAMGGMPGGLGAPAVPNDGLNHDPGVTVAPMPQRCILLRNMFDPKTETDPNFDEVPVLRL